jgi:5-methylcytosine-specific restriction enzyme A
MKINLAEIKILFAYAEKFHNKEISRKKALSALTRKGIKRSSAQDYIYNYSNLVEGRIFTRTMNVISTKYYLDKILETRGIETLKKALQSLSLHITYYEGITNSQVVKRKKLLNEYLERYNIQTEDYFGEELYKEDKLLEGSTKTIKVNIYERNPLARKKCIEHFGAKCTVCEFDFEKKYSRIGRGFIHVHHTLDISEIGKEYEVDYTKDLIPVCPNCHAMLHKKKPAYTVEQLKAIIS